MVNGGLPMRKVSPITRAGIFFIIDNFWATATECVRAAEIQEKFSGEQESGGQVNGIADKPLILD